jgi:hypothetical protein
MITSEPRQAIMKIIGESGCYFLSLVRAAEIITQSRIDAVNVYNLAVMRGYMKQDCFVLRPDMIMAVMTNQMWSIHKEGADYKTTHGEIVIHRYEWSTPRGLLAHFILALEDGTRYDPLGESQTVKNGKLVSMRVLRRIL